MSPLDQKTGGSWSSRSVGALTARFTREADAELRARDTERSGGVLCAENGYKCYGEDSNGRFVVDHSLSRMRHTGRDRRLLRNRKMAEFCLEPKSESEFVESHILGDLRRAHLLNVIEQAKSGETAARTADIPPSPGDAVVGRPPRKRGPGRPRKDQFAEV